MNPFKTICLLILVMTTMMNSKANDIFEERVKLNINGIDQSIICAGSDTTAPILLLLHGHGMPTSIFAHHFINDSSSQLTKKFIQVHWDQRGSGLSYSKKTDPTTMTQDQFVEDAYEVVQYLKKRFDKDKVYIWAMSWGSIIGLKLVQKYPDDIAGFIGEGQTADYQASIKNMYEYALQKAGEENNKKALKQLKGISFPDSATSVKDFMKFNDITAKWASKFILDEYQGQDVIKVFKESMRTSPYYKRFKHKMSILAGMKYTQMHTLKGLFYTNLCEEIDSLSVPVYFFMGKYDFITPSTELFYNELVADQKELVIFENSGHTPSLDEAELFEKELLRVFEIQ